jgi:Ca2+-binding RTX toxin-like protein
VTSNPFGAAPTTIYLGLISPYGTYVAYSRNSDGACGFYWVGDTTGLSDNVVMYGGGGDDTIIHLYNSYLSLCGYSFSEAADNGRSVTSYGLAGNDTIWVGGGNGPDYAYGGAGNDWIRTLSPTGLISGDDGNDTLMSDAMSGISDRTYGGNGDDCLEDESQSAAAFDCGAGYDKAFYLYPPNRSGCEVTSTSCN